MRCPPRRGGPFFTTPRWMVWSVRPPPRTRTSPARLHASTRRGKAPAPPPADITRPWNRISPSSGSARPTPGPILRAQLVGNAGAFGAVLGAGGNGQIPAFASRGLAATFNDFRAPLTVSYELDVFGRIRHAYASARASAQAAEADRRAVALSLSADVATGYFALRALDSRGGRAAAQPGTAARRRASEPGAVQRGRRWPLRPRPRESGTRQHPGRRRGDHAPTRRTGKQCRRALRPVGEHVPCARASVGR